MGEHMKVSEESRKVPRIDILTPVYNEQATLQLYTKAVTETLLSREDYDFHVLFIEDGSRDRSWEIIKKITDEDDRFEGLRLSRNFGSHLALSAGFDHVKGDAIVTLACDLQDPPETVLEFLKEWRAGYQVVWGRRRSRKDKLWKVLTSGLFYRLMCRFAMPPDSEFATGSFLLADRIVGDAFRQFHERNRVTFALVAWTGFRQGVVEYDRRERIAGVSGWSLWKMLKTMYDAFIGFSMVPVRLMTISGVVASLTTVVLATYLLATWWFESPAPGWTSQMLVVAFFFGIQFFLMGVSGEYLYRIYAEAAHRPLYFISDRAGSASVVEPEGGDVG